MSALLLKSQPILDFFDLQYKTSVENKNLRLDIFLIGDDKASHVYVNKKIEFAQKISIEVVLHKYESDIDTDFIKSEIKKVSDDDAVNGVMIQLPLPKHLNVRDLYNQIDSKKDIESLSDTNILKRARGEKTFIPATARAVQTLFDFYKIDLRGLHVVMIGYSDIVGKPVVDICLSKKATVTICNEYSKDIRGITKIADIIIVAIGKANFIDESYVRDDNTQIIIDIGINDIGVDEVTGKRKICGDVDFEKVKDKVKAITPVPGGVGPLTVMSLMENLRDSVL